MYTTNCYYYRYGKEDYVDTNTKEFDTLDKAMKYAIKYAKRYATGIRFISVEVLDNKGNVVYEILQDGRTFVNGKEVEKLWKVSL